MSGFEASPLRASVSLELASEVDRALIDGMAQFYIYDFSEMSPITATEFAIGESGQFSQLPGIDDYWGQDGAYALVIRCDGLAAGFVLINTHSHRYGGTVARNMGEFFVARQYRRCGIATEAVRRVFERYPGDWEIAVAEQNAAAKAFWPRAIAAAPNVTGMIRVEGDGQRWCGPIWCFTVL